MWTDISHLIIRNRITLLVLILIATVFMGWKAKDVQWSFEFQTTVPKTDKDYIYYQDFKKEFGDDGTAIGIALKDSSLYKLENFMHFSELNDSIKNINGVEQVLSVSNFKIIKKDTTKRKFVLKDVKKTNLGTKQGLNDHLELIKNNTLISKQIINKDNGATFILIYCDKKIINSKLRNDFFNKIREFGKEFERKTNIKLKYAGLPYVRATVAEQLKREVNLFTIFSIIIAGIVLAFLFRSWDVVVFPLAIIGIVIVWVMGSLALLDYKITMMTGLIPPIITVIGIPNSVYLINKYHQQFDKYENKIKATSTVIRKIGMVTIITNFTTATGFIVLNFTDIPILREFGVIAGMNILVAYLVSIILLPNIFIMMPNPDTKQLRHLKFSFMIKAIYFFTVVSKRFKLIVYLVTLALLIISFIGISKLEAISYLVDDIPQDNKVKKDMLFFDSNFKGILPMEIVVDTGRKKGIMSLSRLKKIEKFEKMLDSLPEVASPLSIVSIIKGLKQSYYNGNPKYYKLPTNRERVFLGKYIGKSATDNEYFSTFVDKDGQIMRINLRVADIGSKKMKELIKYIDKKGKEIFKDSKITAQLTGIAPLFSKGSDFLVKNLWTSMLIAFFVIAVLIGILFSDLRMVILSIVPNLVPIIITAGFMGFMGIPLKPSTTLIFSVIFGISVDDSLHYLTKYRQELQSLKSETIQMVVARCLRETGSSMIYTSIILFAGFSIFSLSDFGGTKALGILTSCTLLLAMFTNLTLLPTLLINFDKRSKKKALLGT